MWARGFVVFVIGCSFTAPSAELVTDGAPARDVATRDDSHPLPAQDAPPIAVHYVQGNGQVFGDTATMAVSYKSQQTAGDFNVVVINWASQNVHVASVADLSGNAYTAIAPTVTTSGETLALYYAANIRSGGNAVTVTFDAFSGAPELKLAEYSGIDNDQPIDLVQSSSSGNGTVADSGPLTTTYWHDLLLGAVTCQSTINNADPMYTEELYVAGDILEDREVTAIGTYDATATLNTNEFWLAELVAFRAAQ